MKEPDYQWQGAQGYRWWELNAAKDKFADNEHELIITVNDNFVISAFTTKKWYEYYWSKIYINNIFFKKCCEHVDEALYWLLDNLEKLVFIQDIKKNKIKVISLKSFEAKQERFMLKPNKKIFTVDRNLKP